MLARFVLPGVLVGLLLPAGPIEARSAGECQLAWSKAVRSYLTRNRKAGPDGQVPKDMDGAERAAEQWSAAFAPACRIESGGDKGAARVEAAAIGVQILAKLDNRGCARFLEYYMQSTRSADICRAAETGEQEDLRRQIEETIPER